MSRQLRSGRNYNASKAPPAPKRGLRKGKTGNGNELRKAKQASKENSKQQLVPKKREQLTFGTTLGDKICPGESVYIVGANKRPGIALHGNNGVKLSPSAYVALTKRAPPIWRVLTWPKPAIKSRMIADAPEDGEAAVQKNAEAAERAPGAQEDAPGSADRAPAAKSVPTTPTITAWEGLDLGDEVYTTARTSRLRDKSLALNSDGEQVLAQYVVNDNMSETPTVGSERKKRRRRKSKGKLKAPVESPSNESKSTANHEGLTWGEEVRRATGDDPGADQLSKLPDLSKWVNPDWSRLDYLPANSEPSAATDSESVQVNALIYKVKEDFGYNDDEYVEVLRNLRKQERSESSHSQTRGAGPSQKRTHQVTVEEVAEESEATETSRTQSYVGKGKGREKPKGKAKKRKRPSLGMALDDLEGPRECTARPPDRNDTNRYRNNAQYTTHKQKYKIDEEGGTGRGP
ncbi:hypothetical protein BN14_06991 [Rhizoctonia solani AG-1 IB]|uniref:Uncharacterized protein n=1 Tax=Thanatephorus cucumeris (strain AG1-IB / isolate 7/3/14) TaxID=1108050 RepID=M5CAR9_THACB|nr:hypothetical protein BN14_06991 [Rhizoctonia solani AG-1 IB]